MAEPSKFSGVLAKLKKPGAAPGHALQPSAPEASPMTVGRGRGRPPGKRSDPAYEPTTVLLRKQTKRAAHRKLEDAGEKADLSTLIEQLLSQWNENS